MALLFQPPPPPPDLSDIGLPGFDLVDAGIDEWWRDSTRAYIRCGGAVAPVRLEELELRAAEWVQVYILKQIRAAGEVLWSRWMAL